MMEIAKVFTRELELWTDTSHLRVRNKIQESIVDFKCFLFLNRYDKDPQRQFEDEERDYLSNFGVNIVNEVLKRRVIIADRAKENDNKIVNKNNKKKKNRRNVKLLEEVSDEACFVGQQMVYIMKIIK
uniref:Uncharacterized protein n=1 Tax=Rhizophagus irregularis (strain DAOM 181602 / DAOM 197198 / MUCL 43194) TaxID=747089 RepID=U9TTG2_RHIID